MLLENKSLKEGDVVSSFLDGDNIGSSCAQPVVLPLDHVKFGALFSTEDFLEDFDQIIESSILPSLSLEVNLQSIREPVETDQILQLLDDGSTFGITDSIEDTTGNLGRYHFCCNWVSCALRILVVTPQFAQQEVDPRVLHCESKMRRTLCACQIRDVICEGFLQPSVIPPITCDTVSKPHVAELV